MIKSNTRPTKILKQLRQSRYPLLLLPLLFFTDELFASCSMENNTAIDFRTITVPENTKTGDIIQSRNLTYYFTCTPNSQRSHTEDFSLIRPSGNITFYRNTNTLFSGIDMRITITDQLGKKHIINPSDHATNIYYITDNDLANGFNWNYNVQIDLIRNNQPLPKNNIEFSSYMQIANFGSNTNVSNILSAGRLYVQAKYTKTGNSCQVTMPNSVTLPHLSLEDLQSKPVRSTFEETDFNISIHCRDSVFANIVFYDVYDSGVSFTRGYAANTLTRTPNSSAIGVQLAIKRYGSIVRISTERYIPGRDETIPNNFTILRLGSSSGGRIPNNSTVTFQYQIAYYKLSQSVSSGTIGGAATVLIDYI